MVQVALRKYLGLTGYDFVGILSLKFDVEGNYYQRLLKILSAVY